MFVIASIHSREVCLTLDPIETPFNAYAIRVDPDLLFAYEKYYISDPTLVDLTSYFFVLCTNMNIYLHNYS